jgi:Tfp pilus assembly protein PilO
MKYLFVSPEKIAQDQYRHGAIFRFAGALLLFGIALQVPCVFFALSGWKELRDRSAEQTLLRTEFSELQKANIPLKEARQKLGQIRQWEPIMSNRIPISSLLNAVQVSIPQDAVLDSISIETEQFDHLPVQGGMYRVPRNYRLVLQGVERPNKADTLQIFCEALQKRYI